MTQYAVSVPQASETERAAWIIRRTRELMAQGMGWSKAMAQARAEAERAGL